jgi:DNA-binding XRE family transcriptional regulator
LPYARILLKALKPKEFEFEPRTLGERIKRRRLGSKLTQREAAEWIGVNPWTVLNWENQKTEPPPRFIPAILRFLG